MFTSYKTVFTEIGKNFSKGASKIDKDLSKGFEKIAEAFEDIGDSIDDIFDGKEWSSTQNSGDTTITNNNGHIVIEGTVKSVKINGVDVALTVKVKKD